ncbi:hypothetical protein IWW50_001746 [Coemansia erecta]|nr:hypothetical protein IWW50_001746 [Coemansia erecta]
MTIIYVDGSCVNNGMSNASAGVGVYFGPGDVRNYSGKLGGCQQNAPRAEVEAIRQALILLGAFPRGGSGHREVTICSDCDAAILAVQKAKSQSACCSNYGVANNDLLRDIANRMATSGYIVKLEKVAGHSNNTGNDKAHELAYAAARA